MRPAREANQLLTSRGDIGGVSGDLAGRRRTRPAPLTRACGASQGTKWPQSRSRNGPDVVREHDRGHAVELGVDHVVGRAEQDERIASAFGAPSSWARCAPPGRTCSRSRRSCARSLAPSANGSVWKSTTSLAPNRPSPADRERSRVGPEPRRVEGGDVAAALARACRAPRRARRGRCPGARSSRSPRGPGGSRIPAIRSLS